MCSAVFGCDSFFKVKKKAGNEYVFKIISKALLRNFCKNVLLYFMYLHTFKMQEITYFKMQNYLYLEDVDSGCLRLYYITYL